MNTHDQTLMYTMANESYYETIAMSWSTCSL